MKNIVDTMQELFSEDELHEDEYINEADGLIYCKECHTPRQTVVTIDGKVLKPKIRCRCREAADEKERAERNSDFANEQVFNVIDSRYRSKKPLIVTTNLTIEELKHPAELSRARIYDRILERCIPLKINNRNIREMNAAATLEKAKKLFK